MQQIKNIEKHDILNTNKFYFLLFIFNFFNKFIIIKKDNKAFLLV
jgi:hypothetical protein